MGHTNDRSTKASSLVNPTSLNLQPRPFAPLESDEKEEAVSRKSGYSENFLEKIINTPSSESATPVQRKSGNPLKAIATERTNTAIQNQPIQRQEAVEEEKSEGEQEEGKEFTMNPEPPPVQRKFENRLRAKTAQRMAIQAKLTIGEPNDKYEQEADATAARVVQQINSPTTSQSQPVQRKFENRLRAKNAQRMEIQAKLAIGEPNDKYEQEADATAARVVQQINSSIPSQSQPIQRQEMEEDEELQMKPLVQRSENIGGGEASTDLESAIQSARGSGQSLDANLQQSMGQAMGADFSDVKVHTDSQSDQLNKSIQAKAFTTGQDLFFRQGAYEPSSRGGQELIAHELTHVVLQNGGSVQRSDAQTSIQRDMDFSSTDLEGSLSKSAKIAKFFGNESTFSKIRALLNKYEIVDASQQYSIMMQLKPLVESWLSKHPVKTKNDNAKKVSLMRLLNAIVEEMQNVKLKNQNLTSESNSETSESSVISSSSSVSDAPEKTIEKEKVTLDKIASDDLSENLDGGSETIEVEAEDIVSEAELADPKPDDTVDVAKLQSDYLKDLNSGKFKFLTTDVALSKDLTKARTEGEELASDYSLTEAEHTAIRIYTGRDYSYMNPVLANNDAWLDSKVKENTEKNKWESFGKDTLDDKEREQIKEEGKRHSEMAVMGLKKLPDENIETYRGLGLSKKDFDDQYQPGKELSFPAFTSTSTNKSVSADFARSEAKGGKVGILILLQVTKGKDINKLSIYPGEGEILLLPGAKFKIGPIMPPSSPGEFYTVKADQTS